MFRMTRARLLLIGLLMMAGCSSPRATMTETVPWPSAAEPLGRTALLIDYENLGPASTHPEKQQELAAMFRETVALMAGEEVVDGATLLQDITTSRAWRQISDHELIVAAREKDIDTVCTVTVERHYGSIGLTLLPPGWLAQTSAAYHLRLLDVDSGRVIADLRRARTRGGYLGRVKREFLYQDLHDDLADLVATSTQAAGPG